MQGAFNSIVDFFTKRDDALEAMVVALREEVALLKEELKALCVANEGMVSHLPAPKWEVPKPNPEAVRGMHVR